jgi:hypothetical protein
MVPVEDIVKPQRCLPFLIAAALVACDPTPILFKTVATGAPLVASGYRAIGAAQDRKYDDAQVALDTTIATMQTALDSAPVFKATHDKRATMELVTSLLGLYEEVRKALAPLGIDK